MIDNLISSENTQSKETKLAWLQASQKALGGQEGMQNGNELLHGISRGMQTWKMIFCCEWIMETPV